MDQKINTAPLNREKSSLACLRFQSVCIQYSIPFPCNFKLYGEVLHFAIVYSITLMNSQGFPDTNFILLESDEFVKEGVLTLFPYYIPTLDMHVQDASEIRRQHLSR